MNQPHCKREEGCMLKEVWRGNTDNRRAQGRPLMRWCDQVKKRLEKSRARTDSAQDRSSGDDSLVSPNVILGMCGHGTKNKSMNILFFLCCMAE